MRTLRRSALLLLVVLLASPLLAHPPEEDDLAGFIRANYTKYEYRIPMRDGARLFTAVYVPKDASETNRYPLLLIRTPYAVDPYGPDSYPKDFEPTEHFARAKYIFAYQDVRGRFMSEGEFVDVRPHKPIKGPAFTSRRA
jgi:predicted acyl esterase